MDNKLNVMNNRKIYKDTILQFIIKYQTIYSDFFYKNAISSDIFKDCLVFISIPLAIK
jgi:hypothetical protein